MGDSSSAPRTSDVIVLGGGPGGYACALRAADLGLSVTLVEAGDLGGTCLNRGCIPTRSMLHAADLADAASRRAARWGVHVRLDGVDMTQVGKARDQVVTRLRAGVEHHLSSRGVELVRGRGTLAGPRDVRVDSKALEARRGVVLATGSVPRPVPGLDPDGRQVVTSDDLFELDVLPSSALIVGGGAVGIEVSQIWRAFGASVDLVEIGGHLAPREDPDLGRELSRSLRRLGIRVHTATEVVDLIRKDQEVTVTLEGPSGIAERSVDIVLVAAGRLPASAGLGLSEAGIRREDGFVTPTRWERVETSVAGVHAIGDLLPPPSHARANAAYAEGMLAADVLAGRHALPLDYDAMPRVTHGLVESAAVGLTEAAARERAAEVVTTSMPLTYVARGMMHGEGGMVKVVAEPDGRVLGIHLVGPGVTEMIGEAALITGFEATPDDVGGVVHAHPTLAESLSETHLALAGRPLHWR